MPVVHPASRIVFQRARPILGACAVIVIATLVFVLCVYMPHERTQAISQWRAQLAVTANDRGSNLERTIADVFADVQIIADYPTTRLLASAEIPPRDVPYPGTAEPHLRQLLAHTILLHGMNNAWILNRSGRLLTSAYPKRPPPAIIFDIAKEAGRTGNQVVRQIGTGAAARTYMSAPIKSMHTGAIVGAAAVELSTADALLGIVTGELVPGTSAEVVLVQKAESTAEIITPTKKAGKRRFALERTDIAGVAALKGRTGFGEFLDYNGDRVFAVTRPIRRVPWALVAKIDQKEALAASQRESLGVGLTIMALLIAMAGAVYGARIELKSERAIQQAREREALARVALEMEQAEQRYEKLNGRAHALLEANVVGVVIGTADGTILEANDYYIRLLGYTRADFEERGVRWIDITPPEHLVSDRRALAELEVAGKSTPYEKEYIRKDGSRVWVLVGDTLLPGPEHHIVAFVIDISAQKSLEAQYQQAQKMEAVGRLAGGVAHDFNNILTAIKGVASLALEECHDGPVHKDLQDIGAFADRATALTKQLLAFSRRQVLQPTVFDIRTLLQGLNRMLCRMIGEDIDLVVEVDEQPAAIHADPSQIEQVILNLAVNARDAMPNGGTFRIKADIIDMAQVPRSMRNANTARQMVRLQVSDTGTGMSEEVQQRLFEPFFTTKDVNKGTGLGLATVYGIVNQSRGAIEVMSAPGKGSTFVLLFPNVVAALTPQYRAVVPEKHDSPITLLLVEDDEAVRALAVRTIRRKGHRVYEARNADEAIRLADRHFSEFDLLLTDLVMPGISGRELVQQIRDKHGPIKTIFMSGYSADVLDNVEQLDGKFLEKPFTPAQLLNVLESAVVSAGTLS